MRQERFMLHPQSDFQLHSSMPDAIGTSLNLLFVSHTSRLGGAELALLELVKGLSDRGFKVNVVLPKSGPLESQLQSARAGVWKLNHEFWVRKKSNRSLFLLRLIKHAWAAKNFVQLLKQLTPDVVVTQTLTIPAAALAAHAIGIPHIWFIHEFGKKDHEYQFDIGLRNSVRLINSLSSKVIVNSRAVFQEFSRYIPADKCRVIYQAVEVPDKLPPMPSADGSFRVILVGTITPSKGQEDAVLAVGFLRKRGCTIKLTLVGEAETKYSAYLQDLAVRLRVEDAIEIVGFTEKRFEKIRQSDVALMCSRCEAFGRVTVEAMKLGVPVIASSGGATDELIREGWNGLIYQHGDARDLSSKIEALYKNKDLRKVLAENGRVWSTSTFSTERYVHEFRDLLFQVLSSRKKRPPLSFA